MSLQRGIGLPTATALVVGTIIGSSIFVQASEITLLVPDPIAVVLAWAVAGALTLVGALVCAELASAYPRTGGVYVYLKEIYSPLLGFVWGWATFWSMHTGILAAIATVFARYAGFFVPLSDTGLRVVAIGAILVLSAVNYVGVRFGGRVQTAFTVVKVLAVIAIIGARLGAQWRRAGAGGVGGVAAGDADELLCWPSPRDCSPSAAGTW